MAESNQSIDIFTHILTPKYHKAFFELLPPSSPWRNHIGVQKSLYELESRFRVMDIFPAVTQVISSTAPPIELLTTPEKSAEMCRMANDEMAELLVKYPDRFIAAIAAIPMNNIDAALEEIDRAIRDLKFRGIQMYTSLADEPIDLPKFIPIYEKMAQYDLPIWLHPYRSPATPDYASERKSKFRIFHIFGWPYETTAAMTRLVFSGVLEKYPTLKIITHHCGGMVPFFASRIVQQQNNPEMRKEGFPLTKSPIEYFKMFYADTALSGGTPALMCGLVFFGADHILFGTDTPYGPKQGEYVVLENINSVNEMAISLEDREKILSGNAKRLLKL